MCNQPGQVCSEKRADWLLYSVSATALRGVKAGGVCSLERAVVCFVCVYACAVIVFVSARFTWFVWFCLLIVCFLLSVPETVKTSMGQP